MVKAFCGGVVARREPVALEAALVVLRIAILEAVGQHEIDELVGRRARAHRGDIGLLRGGMQRREQQRERGPEMMDAAIGAADHAATPVGDRLFRKAS